MEDQPEIPPVHTLIKDEQKKYEREVAPRQREILDNLIVSNINELLPNGAVSLIDDAFRRETNFSTYDNEILAHKLDGDDSGNVREVVLLDENSKSRKYLVRRNRISDDLTSTEIFRTESFVSKHTQGYVIPYEKYIISDNNTGNSTDLVDLSRVSVYEASDKRLSTAALPFGVVINTNDHHKYVQENTASSLAHEAGHTWQDKNLMTVLISMIDRKKSQSEEKLSESSNARIIVSERNAWAFALNVARAYREKGLDLTSIITYKNAERALSTYQSSDGDPQAGLNYSKRNLKRQLRWKNTLAKFINENTK